MNELELVKKVVGEKIKKWGFIYLKTEQHNYYFFREIEGIDRYYDPSDNSVRQYILIQKNRFANLLTVRFYTDVYGNETVHDIFQLKNPKVFPNLKSGWICYNDSDSYTKALEFIVSVIDKYGIELLKTLSNEEEIIPTKDMAKKLYEEHEELEQKFIEKYSIKCLPDSEKDVDDWFVLVKKIINECIDEPYENVKEKIIEISAFLGNRVCEILSQKWIFPEYSKVPLTSPTSSHSQYHGYKPLITVVMLWKDKNNEEKWYLLEEYFSLFKSCLFEK